MFKKLFKRKQVKEKVSLVGRKAELFHDVTVFQYGTVFIDDERYSVKTVDNAEYCKGTLMEVLEENDAYLLVKKAE